MQTGTSGYGRVQTSLMGASDLCFSAPGAGSKYRLGNECESWIELGLYQDLNFDNGIKVHSQVRPLFYGPNDERIDFFEWGEFFTEWSNLPGIEASFWVGRRFYRRFDVHMSDFWYLNMSGDGAGIGDVALGGFDGFYALTFDQIGPEGTQEKALLLSHDFRLLKRLDDAQIHLFANYMYITQKRFDAQRTLDATTGWAMGVLYQGKSDVAWGIHGEHTSGLLYGQGLSKDAGSYVPFMQKQFDREALAQVLIDDPKIIDEAQTWRLIHHHDWQNDQLGMMANLVYEYRFKGRVSTTGRSDWFSLGLRPYLFVNEMLRLVGEVGYDHVLEHANDQQFALLKTTAAVELATQKGVSARPVLRLYYTHATWSEDAKGLVGTSDVFDETSGDNAGVQLEYWW